MSSDNPFGEAMDEAEESESSNQLGDFDLNEFIAGLNEGEKTETIGVAVTKDMHTVWKELRSSDDVDIDLAESIRNHLENVAQRHAEATERAGRKRQIDKETEGQA